jgi:DNA polymerase III epsilon subunit-like protein
MNDWSTDEALEKTREFLRSEPDGDKRAELAGLLGITEYKARELIRAASLSGPTWGIFDLETTKLEGHFGRLLCGSVLSYPAMEMVTHKWPEYEEDFSDGDDEIEKHTISCGYFSKGFDIGFLNARLLFHGRRLLRPMLHHDPIWGFKGWRGVKIGSASMKNVAEYLGLSAKEAAQGGMGQGWYGEQGRS